MARRALYNGYRNKGLTVIATQLHVESERAVEDPTLEQIERALACLDGSKVTFVGIKGDRPDQSITIGGGTDGKYVVSATFDNRRFFTVINPDAKPGRIAMPAGGQLSEFDATQCVDRPAMMQAVRTFVTTGELDKALKWARS
jgi:hypothetical protein